MAGPVFQRYPCPASLARVPTDNFRQKEKPGGGFYKRRIGHGGSDIPPKRPKTIGDPVFPVRDGVVEFVGKDGEDGKWGSDYGNRVLVKHRFTFRKKKVLRFSFYAHLDTVKVKTGQTVTIATPLGTMGKTGTVTGPHVHFEWHSTAEWRSGIRDPFPLLDEIRRIELDAAKKNG